MSPKSTAPVLSPQTVASQKKDVKKEKRPPETPTNLEAAASAPPKVPTKAKVEDAKAKAAKQVQHTEKQALAHKSEKTAAVAKDKPKAALKPASADPKKQAKPAEEAKVEAAKTSKKVTNTAANKAKQPAASHPQTTNKAKVNLSPKGVARSVSDLLSKQKKTQPGLSNNAAIAETLGPELTGTAIDILNKHMKRFWNMPSGHKNAANMIVEVEIWVKPDGCVEKAEIIDQRRLRDDNEFRIAAECALRAILDPDCSPLPLTPREYKQLAHMIFVFDPSEMCVVSTA
ncbi:MAG: hypothetical protein LBF72_03655 [Holosporales bacterium]|nr:hypothetical protein [Holosporales bacterium]